MHLSKNHETGGHSQTLKRYCSTTADIGQKRGFELSRLKHRACSEEAGPWQTPIQLSGPKIKKDRHLLIPGK